MADNKSKTHKQYWIKKEIDKKIEDYSKLTGVTKTAFLVELIENFFKNKVVTKEFISPEKQFYFNMNELLNEGTVKAISSKPSRDFDNYYTVKKIPNNLDFFSEDFKSYCYNGVLGSHRGIFIYYFFSDVATPVPLLFNYNDSSVKNELEINLIKLKDLSLLIETEEDVNTIKDLFKSIECNTEKYDSLKEKKYLVLGYEEDDFFIEFPASISNVIEEFSGRKKLDLLSNFSINEFDSSLAEEIDKSSIPLDSIIKTEDIIRIAIENEKLADAYSYKIKLLYREFEELKKDIL